MNDKQKQIEETKKEIEILKQELKNKEMLLNSLLNMFDKYNNESEEDD